MFAQSAHANGRAHRLCLWRPFHGVIDDELLSTEHEKCPIDSNDALHAIRPSSIETVERKGGTG